MSSQLITKLLLDDERLKNDINTIINYGFSDAYKEYAFGNWETVVIWNQDGKQEKSEIYDYSGFSKPTELGIGLPYINHLIESYFHVQYMKFARIFSVSDNGVVIPHRDYLELKKDFYRIHIPIQTDEVSFSSEENNVFQMQYGEVWFLDATKVHSATSASKNRRLHLVLDFYTENPMETLFKFKTTEPFSINFIERKEMTNKYLDSIYSLSNVICMENFNDIVALLSKIHFKIKVPADELFKWLINIAKKSKNDFIIDKVEHMYTECIINRNTASDTEIMRDKLFT